ncbi:AMP-binding protein [Chelatococcus sp. SYSU_G07232]|uniref:AMP-binding protein n=1 Tax=Chelatococcus albus TaxID=3047466 RepID=A0ABT7ABY4_9HYPH|nr:AMP-binding protein [Chelatococcus sp. SYSU_G07232]MDJ1156876.1 AMP-binding protein [Chelatococcus sp. SYSU_G07232]
MRLARLLAGAARREPTRIAFRAAVREARVSRALDASLPLAAADAAVRRLSAFFAGLPVQRQAAVGFLLPNGPEACIGILAALDAGLRPCLLPLAWPVETIAQAVEAAGVEVLVTAGRIDRLAPAEDMCRLAAGFYGLRFIAAFGADVPDGVAALDAILADDAPPPAITVEQPFPSPGIVTFASAGERPLPVLRSEGALVAATLPFVLATGLTTGQRIVQLLAPDDLAGLATGLAAALIGGATLVSHGLFDAARFLDDLGASQPTVLVAPGWMAQSIDASGLLRRDGTLVCALVHQASGGFSAGSGIAGGAVVDVLALDEAAMLVARRDANGGCALALGAVTAPNGGTRPLLEVRTGAAGGLEARGPAVASPVALSPSAAVDAEAWHALPFTVTAKDGRILSVARDGDTAPA